MRAVADQRSNGLLISANVHFFPQILKLIEELDAATDQVLIEARLVEVSSDFLDKLGVRWSPDGSKVFTADDFDNSILAHASGVYRKGFGGTTSVNNPAASGSLSQVLGSLRSGERAGLPAAATGRHSPGRTANQHPRQRNGPPLRRPAGADTR